MMTKCELIGELKKKGIKGYSKLNRADMVNLLSSGRSKKRQSSTDKVAGRFEEPSLALGQRTKSVRQE